MKPRLLATALVLLAACAATARADEFSDLAHAPGAYWVQTRVTYASPPGYYGGPPPGYYGNPPPPYYYAPPPPPVGVFFHFHFH